MLEPVPWFLKPFRRITSSGRFIPEIDGLRFISILFVFIYHLVGDILRHTPPGYSETFRSTWLFALSQHLDVGIQLFFVISGAILGIGFAAPHLRHSRPVALSKYYRRRLTRLEPPYLLSLLLIFVLKVTYGRGTPSQLFPHLAASLAYAHNAIYQSPSAINFVAWSLEVEVQFYLLAPFLAWGFAIRQPGLRRLVWTSLIVLSALQTFLPLTSDWWGLSLVGQAHYFFAGFLFADLYLSTELLSARAWNWDLISLFGWIALAILLVSGGLQFKALVLPWLFLLLLVGAFRGVLLNRWITNPWIVTIGGMCYSIYLLHNYAIATLGFFTERFLITAPIAVRFLLQLGLMAPIILFISAIYFRLVERPCMRADWPERLLARFARRTRSNP